MSDEALFLPAVTQEEFQAMSVDQRWVAVARDVLAQLDAKRFIPSHGAWCHVRGVGHFEFSRESLIAAAVPECYACGVGGVFLSTLRLGNRFTAPGIAAGIDDFADFLRSWLGGRERYEQVEYAFEQGDGMTSYSDFAVEEEDALAAFSKYNGGEPRLRAIMERIIENDGPLVPREVAT